MQTRPETLIDFKYACPFCHEPQISFYKGNIGYSIPSIDHKVNCEYRKNQLKTASEIFKSIPKKFLKFSL